MRTLIAIILAAVLQLTSSQVIPGFQFLGFGPLIAVILAAVLQLTFSQVTPGFQFLGFGYDALKGNPLDTSGAGDVGFRTSVFEFTTKEGHKTADGKWDIPDKTTAQQTSSCSVDQTTSIINSGYAYNRLVKSGFDLSGSVFGVDFGLSVDSKHVRQTTENRQSIFSHVTAQCSVYKLSMHTFDAPALDSNFAAGVQYLPLEFDEHKYYRFIHEFGTHAVVAMVLGGRWGWQSEFRLNDFQKLVDDSIDVSANIGYAGKVKAGLNVSGSTNTSLVSRVMRSVSRNSSFNTGGDFNKDVYEWVKSVRDTPMPVHMSLIPLAELLSSDYLPGVANLTTRSKLLGQAVNGYCGYVNRTDGPVECTPAKPIPLPIPHGVRPNATRRVCLKNGGGFALSFDAFVVGSSHSKASGMFANGESRCLDGMQFGAQRGDVLECTAHIVGGSTTKCDGDGFPFDDRATLAANYECTGSTFVNKCKFTGLSE